MMLAARRLRWTLAAAISVIGISPVFSSVGAQGPSPCADSAAALTQVYKDSYASIVSRTDSETVAFRNISGLPTLIPSQVRLVGDTAVCRAASIAFDARLAVPYPSKPVIVLELGNKRIVVKDTGRRGPRLNMLFNQDFTSWMTNIGY